MDVRVILILALLGIVQCTLIGTCNDTKTFVDSHNLRRLLLATGQLPGQPAASKMTYLIWDEELATKASNWASRNVYGHNPDRTVPSGRFTTGENIYLFSTTSSNHKFNSENAMNSWWNEYKDFTYKALSSADFTSSTQIGHYTQMAWAKSIKLGCGISQYLKNNWNNFYVVCNYAPAGNVLGQTPYNTDTGPSGALVCGEADCSQKYGTKC